jgi:hypothetical protein
MPWTLSRRRSSWLAVAAVWLNWGTDITRDIDQKWAMFWRIERADRGVCVRTCTEFMLASRSGSRNLHEMRLFIRIPKHEYQENRTFSYLEKALSIARVGFLEAGYKMRRIWQDITRKCL